MKFDRLKVTVCLLTAIAIILVIGVIVNSSVAPSYLPVWHSAGDYAPSGLMSQFEKDSVAIPEEYDISKMMIQKVSFPEQANPLFLIDTRMSEGEQKEPLCGVAGCLFTGYIKTGWREFKPVFNLYLNPYVPLGHELLWADMTMRNGMPVLYIIQRASPTKTALVRATLVFNGSQYVVVMMD